MATSLAGTGKMVGAEVKRVEDPRMLLGKSQYVDDIHLPDTLALAFVRSPYAHAHILSIDTSTATAHLGVQAVITGEDVAAVIKPLRVEFNPAAAPTHKSCDWPVLVRGEVRFVGEMVVAVIATHSNVTHLATVEVDPETGHITLLRYIVVEDCGRIINPIIVDGQIQGGVAQGIGTAMYEHAIYDENGQFLTGTLLDYLVPTALDIPRVEIGHIETPSPFSRGGIKGMGEGGAIAPPAAIANAVADALSPFGAQVNAIPLTPERVLTCIERTRSAAETRD